MLQGIINETNLLAYGGGETVLGVRLVHLAQLARLGWEFRLINLRDFVWREFHKPLKFSVRRLPHKAVVV